jgi:general stress protein 26
MPAGISSAAKPTVDRLLATARETIAKARYCWAVTVAERGGANARPMGQLPHVPGEDEWTKWFLTNGGSRKAAEIRRTSRITLVYQRESDDAYITLMGHAVLVDDPSAVRSRWQKRYNDYFPNEPDPERPNALFFGLDANRIELWVRGVTPEPFGLTTTVLERDSARQWKIVSG